MNHREHAFVRRGHGRGARGVCMHGGGATARVDNRA